MYPANCKIELLLDKFQQLTWRAKMSTPFENLLLKKADFALNVIRFHSYCPCLRWGPIRQHLI